MTVVDNVELKRHASTHSDVVRSIEVDVCRFGAQQLQIRYRVDGDISRVELPPARPQRIAAELWQHTCFEAFVALEGQSGYHEFNFAPSGEWAVRAFRGYRDGVLLSDEEMNPRIATDLTDGSFAIEAAIYLNRLSQKHTNSSLRIGVSAVIEARDGLSYWALCHPLSKPDFHDARGFALQLAPLDA